MIRINIIIFLFLISNYAIGQQENGINVPRISESDKFGFLEIIDLNNKSASDLYNSTKSFLIKKHADKEFHIDRPNIELYDKGSFPANFKVSSIQMTYTILYNFSAEFKENKVRIIITDFKVSTNSQGTTLEVPLENHFENMSTVKSGKRYARKMNESLSKSITEQAEKLLSELKESLLKKKSDW